MKLLGARGRISVVAFDQMLSGASNIVVTLLAAHLLGVAGFGVMMLAVLAYAFAQVASRSLVSQPLLVHPEDVDNRPGAGLSATLLLGAVSAVVALIAGLIVLQSSRTVGLGILTLAAFLPGLLVQDLGRFLGFAAQRPMRAVLLDTVWLVVELIGFTLLWAADSLTVNWFLACWAASGSLAGLLVFWQYRGNPIRGGIGWLKERWAFSWRMLSVSMSNQGASLVGSSMLGGVLGTAAIGQLRGAMVLARPSLNVVLSMILSSGTEIARHHDNPARARAHIRRVTILTTGLGIANALVLVLIPDWLGEILLGQTWEAVDPLLFAAALQTVAIASAAGARSALSGHRLIRKHFWVGITGAVLIATAMGIGAALGGAKEALYGIALVQALMSATYWAIYLRWRRSAVVAEPSDEARDDLLDLG